MTRIRVIVKQPGQPLTLRWIEDNLDKYQAVVGGYIEAVPLDGVPGIVLICNEKDRLRSLEPNVINGANVINGPDVIVGPVIAARVSGEDFSSLTESDLETVIEALEAADVSAAADPDGGDTDDQSGTSV